VVVVGERTGRFEGGRDRWWSGATADDTEQ